MNKAKELANKRIDLFHLIVVEVIIGLLLIMIYKGSTIEQFLKLVDILIWPIVILSALFFFRKIFTYFFFTFKKFNFFGVNGELRNPIEVIDQVAEERLKQELEKREREKKEKEYKIKLEKKEKEYKKIILEMKKMGKEAWKANAITEKVLDNLEKVVSGYKVLNEKYTKYLNKEIEHHYFKEALKEKIKQANEIKK